MTGILNAVQFMMVALTIVSAVALLYSAYLSLRSHPEPDHGSLPPDPLARRLRLDSTFPSADGPVPYHVQRVPAGFGLMGVAGALSGLLGIGSGAVKVLAMDHVMRLPFKVSTTTSNFMIGVTAAASAGVYLTRGYIDPGLAMPVTLGVLVGSFLGAHVLVATTTRWLRAAFGGAIAVLAVEMISSGMSGRF